MAHRITVRWWPHQNADGKTSLTRKDWFFRDRNRSGIFLSPFYGSKKACEEAIVLYRNDLVAHHQKTHPNDKRGMKKISDGKVR